MWQPRVRYVRALSPAAQLQAMLSVVLATVEMSVCLSVFLSVFHPLVLYQNEQNQDHAYPLTNSQKTLVFAKSGPSRTSIGSPRPRVLNESRVGTNWRLSAVKLPYLRNGARWDKGCYLSLAGSRVRIFDCIIFNGLYVLYVFFAGNHK